MSNPTKLTSSVFRSYPDLMTVKELQNALNTGRTKAYQLVKRGDIRSIKIGAEYRIPKTYLLEYLNRNI